MTTIQPLNSNRLQLWRERRRKIAAEVPDGALVYEITGTFRNGRFVWLVLPKPVRVVRHGDWDRSCLVIEDPAGMDGTRCIFHWARRAPKGTSL